MTKFKFHFAFLLLSVLFIGCNPNDDNLQSDAGFAQNFGHSVSRNFMGIVSDTNGQPLQNVAIKIGSSTATTDVNGVFIIRSADVYQKFAYITAKKTGYLDGSRSLVPTTGMNNVKIMMIPSTPLQTIASGTTSEVSVASGTKVIFDGSFEDENGNDYTGDVSVSMFHLSPSDANISKLMPGMLYAKDIDGKAKVLATLGMLNVELRGSAGQKLQIKNGHTAKISVKIDGPQLAAAPASIRLWHFDDVNGYWKEDGTATRQGDFYVGDVTHFSWWNCDMAFPVVTLHVKVVNAAGVPLPDAYVAVQTPNTSEIGGITDNNGQISGLVPANEAITIRTYNACGEVINTTEIGPITSETTLPDIVVNNLNATDFIVKGTMLQCNGANVADGYVIVKFGGYSEILYVDNGEFSTLLWTCNPNLTQFTLQGFDYQNLQVTNEISYTFTSPVTNVGSITACNSISEFISYQIDSLPAVTLLMNVNASGDGGANGISISGEKDFISLYIHGTTAVPGTYSTSQFSLEGNDTGYISSQTNNTLSFILSHYGAPGDFVDLTFNGTYTDSLTHTITGTVHTIRDN